MIYIYKIPARVSLCNNNNNNASTSHCDDFRFYYFIIVNFDFMFYYRFISKNVNHITPPRAHIYNIRFEYEKKKNAPHARAYQKRLINVIYGKVYFLFHFVKKKNYIYIASLILKFYART